MPRRPDVAAPVLAVLDTEALSALAFLRHDAKAGRRAQAVQTAVERLGGRACVPALVIAEVARQSGISTRYNGSPTARPSRRLGPQAPVDASRPFSAPRWRAVPCDPETTSAPWRIGASASASRPARRTERRALPRRAGGGEPWTARLCGAGTVSAGASGSGPQPRVRGDSARAAVPSPTPPLGESTPQICVRDRWRVVTLSGPDGIDPATAHGRNSQGNVEPTANRRRPTPPRSRYTTSPGNSPSLTCATAVTR